MSTTQLDAPVTGSAAVPEIRPARRRGRSAWQWVGIVPGAAIAVLAIIGPWLPHRAPGRIVTTPYAHAGSGLWLGGDALGRDVLAQALCGGRALVIIPFVATVATTVLGTAAGIVGGYLGGWADRLLTLVENVLIALPPIIVLLTLLDGWRYSATSLIAAVVLTGFPIVSRVSRAATVTIRSQGYVDQAIAFGDGPVTVMTQEIAPNVLAAVLADAGTRLAVAITLTASAGFLGFGPDRPNWGAMVSANVEGISLSPWGVFVPSVLLGLLTISANLTLDRVAARVAGR